MVPRTRRWPAGAAVAPPWIEALDTPWLRTWSYWIWAPCTLGGLLAIAYGARVLPMVVCDALVVLLALASGASAIVLSRALFGRRPGWVRVLPFVNVWAWGPGAFRLWGAVVIGLAFGYAVAMLSDNVPLGLVIAVVVALPLWVWTWFVFPKIEEEDDDE